MSNFLHYALSFAVVLGVLVIVHEFGHYFVARRCGVRVLRFSVGFGRPLLKRTAPDGTEWVLGLIPLGGYVKMLDEREGPVRAEDVAYAFNRQRVGKRMAIVAAGPLANFVLAVCLYWGIFVHGTEELRPLLGTPVAASPAERAGIVAGERVRTVDGNAVATWEDLRWLLIQRAGGQAEVTLETINARSEINLRHLDLGAIRAAGWEGDAIARLGLTFFRPHVPPVIGKVIADSVAEHAGLRAGDVVQAIDGAAIADWADLVQAVRAAGDRKLVFSLRRGDGDIELDVTPAVFDDEGHRVGRIGVAPREVGGFRRDDFTVVVREGVAPAFVHAVRETWEKSTFTLVMFGRMLTGEVSWHNLSGPMTIADYAGQSARLGIEYYLKFMALVSISLGVLNLLPIPILDGGHLMYYLVEIAKRSPVSARSTEIGQQIGLALLLMLMAFAFYNDISRFISG